MATRLHLLRATVVAAVIVVGSTVGAASSRSSATAASPRAATATGGVAPAEDRTSPRVLPRTGSRRTRFVVRFTLRRRPGHQGVTATSYGIAVAPPAHARAACRPPAPRSVDDGEIGDLRRVALRRPAVGWCSGAYVVTVLLQTGPYCPPVQPQERPPPCPLFASQAQDTGHAPFTVVQRAAASSGAGSVNLPR